MLEIEKMHRPNLKHKARLRWVIDGDENFRFFHLVVNNNKRKNRINEFIIDDVCVNDPVKIRNKAWDFFSNK